jgi:hypothetical protein
MTENQTSLAPGDGQSPGLSVPAGSMGRIDTSGIPRPAVGLRSALVGCVGYEGETDEQMRKRWAAEEEHEARCKAEEERLWRWKITPWWDTSSNTQISNAPTGAKE